MEKTQRQSAEGEGENWRSAKRERKPGTMRPRERAKRGLRRERGGSGTYDHGGPIAVQHRAPMIAFWKRF